MKPIKQYIKESLFEQRQTIHEGLFDDEDDLISQKTTQEAINWFLDESNANILWDHNKEVIKSIGVNTKGEIFFDIKLERFLRLYSPIPDWIKSDKENWDKHIRLLIEYPIKSQKDIPSAGLIGSIDKSTGNLNNLKIKCDSVYSGYYVVKLHNIKSIKNLDVEFDAKAYLTTAISIIDSSTDFKDLCEIHTNHPTRVILINDKGLVKRFLLNILREIKRDGLTYFIPNDHQEDLKKMLNNGIEAIVFNKTDQISLMEHNGKILIYTKKLISSEKDYIKDTIEHSYL